MGFGILCSNVYPLFKGRLRKTAVKLVEGAISAESTTKTFMEEVHEKALERRQERFKKASENLEAKSQESNEAVLKNLELIRKQIEELRVRIDSA